MLPPHMSCSPHQATRNHTLCLKSGASSLAHMLAGLGVKGLKFLESDAVET